MNKYCVGHQGKLFILPAPSGKQAGQKKMPKKIHSVRLLIWQMK
jgi:hypothetical protein